MGLYDPLRRQTRQPVERIDVLREHAEELALLVEEAEEVVREGGVEVAGVQLLGEGKEGLRGGLEVADLEDGFWVGELVLG